VVKVNIERRGTKENLQKNKPNIRTKNLMAYCQDNKTCLNCFRNEKYEREFKSSGISEKTQPEMFSSSLNGIFGKKQAFLVVVK